MKSVTMSFNTDDTVICFTDAELDELKTIMLERFIIRIGINETLWRKVQDSK